MRTLLTLVGLFLIVAALPPVAWASDEAAEVTPESAHDALQRQDLEVALSQHEALLRTHGPQADVYYNLGLIHGVRGDWPLAILSFERALALEPGASDATEHLDHAREALNKTLIEEQSRKITQGEPEAMSSWRFYRTIGVGVAAWSLLTLWLLAFAALIARQQLRRGAWRDASLLSASLLFVAAVALGVYLWGYHSSDSLRPAIVTAQDGVLRSGPTMGAPGKQPDDLYRGALVRVLSSRGEWFEVELADGERGWLKSDQLADIRTDRW